MHTHPFITFAAALLFAALALSAFALPTSAQPLCPDSGLNTFEEGPAETGDPTTEFPDAEYPVGAVLDATEACAISLRESERALALAGESGDASYIPQLKRLAEGLSTTYPSLSFLALNSLWQLGADRSYFVEQVRRYESNEWIAYNTIRIMAREPDSALYEQELAPILETTGSDPMKGVVDNYRDLVRDKANIEGARRMIPADSTFLILVYLANELASGGYNFYAAVPAFAARPVDKLDTRSGGYWDAEVVFGRNQIREVATEHPEATQAFIDSLPTAAYLSEFSFTDTDHWENYTPAQKQQVLEGFQDYLTAAAFPEDTPSGGGDDDDDGGGGGDLGAWQSLDIGSVAAEGSFEESVSGGDTTHTIGGSGRDIWNQADAFHFAHQQRLGEGAQITARVTSQENTNAWAKAGVMIRETLTPGSRHAFLALTPGNGLAFQRRPTTGGSSKNTGGGSASAPVWVRLERSGDTFTASRSPDGQHWSTVGSATVPMADSVYAGLAVTSHNDGTVSEATFTDVSLDTAQAPPPPPADSLTFATNAGGAAHTTGGGTLYQADARFSGGQTATTGDDITGTEEDVLYQSERYGDFSYAVPVPESGDYEVTLRFAEIYWDQSGKRAFDVRAEGEEIVTDLDLYAEVGKDAAYDVVRTVTVTDGRLDLTFSTDVDNAKVSAIEVRPVP